VCKKFLITGGAGFIAIDQATQIYHYSNKGKCSWYEFAKEIFNLSNIKCEINPGKNIDILNTRIAAAKKDNSLTLKTPKLQPTARPSTAPARTQHRTLSRSEQRNKDDLANQGACLSAKKKAEMDPMVKKEIVKHIPKITCSTFRSATDLAVINKITANQEKQHKKADKRAAEKAGKRVTRSQSTVDINNFQVPITKRTRAHSVGFGIKSTGRRKKASSSVKTAKIVKRTKVKTAPIATSCE